jgi:glycosyltransferase involved in cell wall biosynthesis
MDLCILIPYYNAFDGLIKTLDSIQYDRGRLLVLIIDDGSQSPLHLREIQLHTKNKNELHVLNLDRNYGIARALNHGIAYLRKNRKFNFVARVDCGDICVRDRFNEQVEYLCTHPDIGLLGTWCLFSANDGSAYLYRTPTEHKALKNEMHFRNVFIHPTVMWRIEHLEFYPENFPHCEDYALFYSQLDRIKTAILPKPLVVCHVNPNGISWQKRREQMLNRMAVVKKCGTNSLFICFGIVKLKLLALLPYGVVFQLKKQIFRPRISTHGI